MSRTVRLYHDDSYLRRFDAEVIAHTTYKNEASIVLDKTLFYPEAGGQLGDRGTLEIDGKSIAVSDVQVDGAGVIHHLVDVAPESLAGPARGAIDRARRRDHMAQHTAQHML